MKSTPLREYQKALVKAAQTAGNHIIVLPTGLGKTRIVVELSHELLTCKPTSHVVFVTATVTLAQQQAGGRPSATMLAILSVWQPPPC